MLRRKALLAHSFSTVERARGVVLLPDGPQARSDRDEGISR